MKRLHSGHTGRGGGGAWGERQDTCICQERQKGALSLRITQYGSTVYIAMAMSGSAL